MFGRVLEKLQLLFLLFLFLGIVGNSDAIGIQMNLKAIPFLLLFSTWIIYGIYGLWGNKIHEFKLYPREYVTGKKAKLNGLIYIIIGAFVLYCTRYIVYGSSISLF